MERCGGWNAVAVVPDGALANMPAVPHDETLLRVWSSAAVYLMRDGQRRWVTSGRRFEQLGLHWGDVRVISDGGAAQIPWGQPL